MSVTLFAPHEQPVTMSVFPNPEFGDSIQPLHENVLIRSMSGRVTTFVKTVDRQKLVFRFRLFYPKAIELKEFIRVHYKDNIRLEDHNGDVWVVNFTQDIAPDLRFVGKDEFTEIILEVEGRKLN